MTEIQWIIIITSLSVTDPFKNKWSSNPCVEHLWEGKKNATYLAYLIQWMIPKNQNDNYWPIKKSKKILQFYNQHQGASCGEKVQEACESAVS